MEVMVVDGRRVMVVPSLDGTPGGVLEGTIVIEDTGERDLNVALVRAIVRAAAEHDRGSTF